MCLNLLSCLGGIDKDERPPSPPSRPPSLPRQTETQPVAVNSVRDMSKSDTHQGYQANADQNAQHEPDSPDAGGGLRPGAAGPRQADVFYPNGKAFPRTDVTETTRSTEQYPKSTGEGSRLKVPETPQTKVAPPVIKTSVDSGGKRSLDKGGQPEAPRAEEFTGSNQTKGSTGRQEKGAEKFSTGRKPLQGGDGDDTHDERSATSIRARTRHMEDVTHANQHDAAYGWDANKTRVADEGSAANYRDRAKPTSQTEVTYPDRASHAEHDGSSRAVKSSAKAGAGGEWGSRFGAGVE